MNCVVISRTDAMGDTLLTIPMAALIKEKFPNCKVIFIVQDSNRPLFYKNPHVDELWTILPEESFPRIFKKIFRKMKEAKDSNSDFIDAFFHVGGSFAPALAAFCARIPIRGGLQTKWPSFLLLNQGVRQRRSRHSIHESEHNLELLKALAIDSTGRDPKYWPSIQFSELAFSTAQDQLRALFSKAHKSLKQERILLHPGMTGHTLNWPTENYAKLVKKIDSLKPGRFSFIISSTTSDRPYLEAFQKELETLPKDLQQRSLIYQGEKEKLFEYMMLLSQCTLFIGPSTGPTHLAGALGIPRIALYSPIHVQRSERWGPYDQAYGPVKVLTPQVQCPETFHCAGPSCPYYECMSKIEIDEVLKQINLVMMEMKTGQNKDVPSGEIELQRLRRNEYTGNPRT